MEGVDDNSIKTWLISAGLSIQYLNPLKALGIKNIEELIEIDNNLLEQIQLTPLDRSRLKKAICKFLPESPLNSVSTTVKNEQNNSNSESISNKPSNQLYRTEKSSSASFQSVDPESASKLANSKTATLTKHAANPSVEFSDSTSSNLPAPILLPQPNSDNKASGGMFSSAFGALKSLVTRSHKKDSVTNLSSQPPKNTPGKQQTIPLSNQHLTQNLEREQLSNSRFAHSSSATRPAVLSLSGQSENNGQRSSMVNSSGMYSNSVLKNESQDPATSKDEGNKTLEIKTDNTSIKTNKYLALSDILPGEYQNPPIHLLRIQEIFVDKGEMMRAVQIANEPISKSVPNKVIMVLGETGSGKSTLINAMINYLFDVEWNDPYRFQIVDDTRDRPDNAKRSESNSQTDYITAYMLPSTPMTNYSLTIIDTPGYGDTRGIARDKQLTHQIKTFFELSGMNSVSHLDAVCFVIKASQTRLTAVQKYIFDSLLGIFSKDIATNIVLMLTFCDANDPPVLKSIQDFKVPYSYIFNFNNSAFFCQKGSRDSFNNLYWTLGIESLRQFFLQLPMFKPQSLTLTKQVLQKRYFLECQAQGLNEKITMGIALLQKLEQDRILIERYQQDIDANREFKVKEAREKFVPESLAGTGQFVTNCTVCNMTCHFPCEYSEENDKWKCDVMKVPADWNPPGEIKEELRDGLLKKVRCVSQEIFEEALTQMNCAICNCHWKKHRNFDHRYKKVIEYEEITSTVLKNRYDEAVQGHSRSQAMWLSAQKDYEDAQNSVVHLIKSLRDCINELEAIALRPSSYTTTDYIDMMIEQEKRDKGINYLEKIRHLEKAKSIANILTNVKNEKHFNPLAKMIK